MPITITDLYRQLFGRKGIEDGNVIEMAEHGRVGGVSTGQPFKYVAPIDPDTGNTLTGGSGTQYTEGDTDSTITGTAMLWEDTSDTLRAVSSDKPLPVEIVAGAGSGGTASADDADFTAGSTSGTPAMGVYESTPTSVTDGDMGVVGITSGRRLKTSATIDAALPAGNNNIGDVDVASSALPTGASTSANQATIIGHLDGVEGLLTTIDADTGNIATSLGSLDNAVDGNYLNVNVNMAGTDAAAGAGIINAQTQRVTIATDDEVNNLLGTIDADTSTLAGAVSGTEMQVDVVAALPAGTNNIGDVDIASIAAGDNNIGNVDLASAIPAGTNAIGKLLAPDIDVTAHTNYTKKYYTNAGAVTDGIIWSPAAGKRWHVVSIIINVSAAATVTLEDDLAAGDSAVMKMELAANSGVAYNFTEKYPLASGEDAADLLITTSAGNVYVTAVGYEI